LVSKNTIAFHSYKGGTGKTTLIANVAARFAFEGYKVCLLDGDLFAPSLSIYFRKKPNTYLNDLLSGQAQISDILVDVGTELDLKGTFLVGFSSSRKEDINDIEVKHDMKWQLEALKRFLLAKKKLFEKYKLDYLFLDTSPGIRYWSVNSLAAADTLLLLMKDSDIDIEGTRKMINDIYDSLSRYGSKYYVVLNKVPMESVMVNYSGIAEEQAWISELERVVGAQVVGSIPCFCDIQFSRHEFLFAIKQPEHPFSKRIATLVEKIKTLN
jgi:chromosome partitioning protein